MDIKKLETSAIYTINEGCMQIYLVICTGVSEWSTKANITFFHCKIK